MTRHSADKRLRFVTLAVLLACAVSSERSTAQSQRVAPSMFDGLAFRAIGPAVFSGRVNDLAVVESNPSTFYVGTTTGGLWKTVNNGTTWEVLFNTRDDVVSIGDVTIDQRNPDLVWVGTGGSQSWGNGVYKSMDGGKTWTHQGLADSKYITRILLDPSDPNIVYVAALGHLYGPNAERGVFKSTDGGTTWSHVLAINADTGASDLVMDPTNSQILYAATYQRRRAAWGTNGGGPGSGIHKSTDGGRTWTPIRNGLPDGVLGNINIDMYRKNPRILYANVEHTKGRDIFRSDDAGATWKKMNEPEGPQYLGHKMRFFEHIRVDPNDDKRIYVLGVNVYMSDNGGRTFVINESAVQSGLWPPTNGLYLFNTSTHSDHRAFWINPNNSNHLISGSDGGICISYDKGKTWDFADNMDLAQLYHVGFDMDTPYRVYLGLQDNLGWGGPSQTRSYLGIGSGEWFLVAGGDGFVAVADPTDARTIYAESQNGNMSRVDRITNERQPIRPEPAEGEPLDRWNFNAPMLISPHAPSTLLMGANRLFRSQDRGHSWQAVSPDLTGGEVPDTRTLMDIAAKDFKIGRRGTYGTLTTITESPKVPGLYYTGADDGTVHVSRDAGKTWTKIGDRFPGLPKETSVSSLVASRVSEGTVYATFAGHRNDDYHPYVYVSTDFGSTWKAITNGIPATSPAHHLAEDLRNPRVLYLGTEFGLFVTLDQGANWMRIRSNLPTVPIYEIVQHPRENDLILATFGRGIWILDDATPIQQAAEAAATDAFLFGVEPATAFNPAHDRWWMWGDRRFWGSNPAPGAAISYFVKNPSAVVRLAISDDRGTVVRTFTDEELKKDRRTGINRIHWNLRHEPLPLPPSQHVAAGVVGFFTGAQTKAHSYQDVQRPELNPLNAPFVLPGEYRVTLNVNGRDAATRTVKVTGDPAIQISDADRRTWHDTAFAVHLLQRTAYQAGEAMVGVVDHVKAIEEAVKKTPAAPDAVKTATQAVVKRTEELRLRLALPSPGGLGGDSGQRIVNLPGQLASLKLNVMGATSLPTAIQMRSLTEARQGLPKAVGDVNQLVTVELPNLHRLLQEHKIAVPDLKLPRPIAPSAERQN